MKAARTSVSYSITACTMSWEVTEELSASLSFAEAVFRPDFFFFAGAFFAGVFFLEVGADLVGKSPGDINSLHSNATSIFAVVALCPKQP